MFDLTASFFFNFCKCSWEDVRRQTVYLVLSNVGRSFGETVIFGARDHFR